jgi:hypothetical protein
VTSYLSIQALQPPFSIGNDPSKRAMLSFNIIASHNGNPVSLSKIASIISAAGLGTLGTNMWYGSLAEIPQDNRGPLISIIATGGLSGLQTHNGDNITRPSVQIIVRAGQAVDGTSGYIVAENKSFQVYAALNGKHNMTV